jgi:hypothetical protein
MSDNQPVHLLQPELQSLLVHWFLASAGRAMPRKTDLPMRTLQTWRDNVALIVPAAFGEARRYYFHVSGEGLKERFGRAMTGRCLRDIDETLRADLRAALESVRRNAAPALVRTPVPRGRVQVRMWSDLVLPLSDTDESVARLIFASYRPAPRARAKSLPSP